tara:strand:- start:151 stop:723 length:573 start_codon:yes stop_codon:yes gene_type:complete
MKCLFLGYNSKKTKLIKFLKKKEFKVQNLTRKINQKDIIDKDIVISFGYKKIIDKQLIKKNKLPIINLHISYLPYNRGSHPNFWSFVDKTPSGVTIHEIDQGIDTGKIIYQKKIYFNYEKNKSLTFKSTYKILIKEIEKLFMKKFESLISMNYKKKSQKKRGTFHSKKDLPKSFKNWDVSIYKFVKSINR